MIEHVYRRTSAASLVHAALVATDDERIARVVEGFGGAAIMTRPDHVSGTDRIAEIVAQLPCRLVVNVQGDEPLIEPATIDAAIAPMLADATLEMSTLCRPLAAGFELEASSVVKVVTDLRGMALHFSRSPMPGSTAHVGLYVYRRDVLLKLAALPPPPRSRCSSRWSSCGPSPTASVSGWCRPPTPRPAWTRQKISNAFDS